MHNDSDLLKSIYLYFIMYLVIVQIKLLIRIFLLVYDKLPIKMVHSGCIV
jgi:hypothetical protein